MAVHEVQAFPMPERTAWLLALEQAQAGQYEAAAAYFADRFATADDEAACVLAQEVEQARLRHVPAGGWLRMMAGPRRVYCVINRNRFRSGAPIIGCYSRPPAFSSQVNHKKICCTTCGHKIHSGVPH